MYLENGIDINKRGLRNINKQITIAKETMGVTDICNIPMVVSDKAKSIAAYNPRLDVMYIHPEFGNIKEVQRLQQGYVCPNNPSSSAIHELFHWQDAYEYRKNGGVISDQNSLDKYNIFIMEDCFNKLKKLEIDLSDEDMIRKSISKYAQEELLVNKYDEILAEYRTKLLLERGEKL